MRVIGLAVVLALGLFLDSLSAVGQQPAKVYRIGYLNINPPSDEVSSANLDRFRQGLRDLGYLEGRNFVLEIRYAESKVERLPELAADLVRLKVDLIVSTTGTAAIAAKKATHTIPIVMMGSGDPVRQGLVASLAHPGGNVTGLTIMSPDLSRKRLELLRELVPRLSHVGVLGCPDRSPMSQQQWIETQAAADVLQVRLSSLVVRASDEVARAFASAAKERVQAVLFLDCIHFLPSHAQMAKLSLQHRLPGMSPWAFFPQAGGLMSYGASSHDYPRRTAVYVDKILKGAKPADLPVEQPTKFELVINRKTAKALGMTIPQTLLLQASQVIE
jgi:putative ABC transport system substrate-binding protein